MALKHYVTFLSPGTMFSNEETREIVSRDADFNIPDNCFAYEFFDREEVVVDDEKLAGAPKNKTGRFYLGKIMSIEEVRLQEPENSILLRNMEINGWASVVKTRIGNYQPLLDDDIVLTY